LNTVNKEFSLASEDRTDRVLNTLKTKHISTEENKQLWEFLQPSEYHFNKIEPKIAVHIRNRNLNSNDGLNTNMKKPRNNSDTL